ncbi:MAG TPA: ubiquinol-cytochrome C chaperone family protein [Xanthobacteraceae bacterium]
MFRRRCPSKATIRALYGAIVAQARSPSFYTSYEVPDTIEGRFDMIVLHQFLCVRRLARDPETRSLGQAVFDLFCRDLDHNLREMGVSDLAVPRQMRAFGEAYYGRSLAYERALAKGPEACAAALARNVLGAGGIPAGALRLAHYVLEVARIVDQIPASALACGALSFPDPDRIPLDATA